MKFLSQINVNTEYTLPIVDGTNGQVLTTDGSGAVYWGSVSIGALNLDGLQDVVITTPTSGQILRYGIPVGSEDPNPVWHNWTPNFVTTANAVTITGTQTITGSKTFTAATTMSIASGSDVALTITKGGNHEALYINKTSGSGNAATIVGTLQATTIVKTGGTASQFLKADGSVDTNTYLTSFTETDPTVPSHVKSISTTDIGNWNIGYNDSIRAIGFSTTTGVLTLTQQDGGTLTVDLDGRYLESYTETDPIYVASTWYDTINNSRDWDDAYSWGNHADAGYLTSLPAHTHAIADVTGLHTALDGKVPTTRTLTINGTAFDLSANRSWTISSADGYISDVRLQESTLEFTGQGSAFSGTIDLSGLPFQPAGSYLTAESDTLATVTARGNISNTKIQIRTAGNTAGGNIQLGPYSDGASKWAFITAQHYNSSLEPEGFSLIGGLAANGVNAVVIGGNIYESNPATQIQFWTHSSDTHGLGGTQRGVIDSSGNWGVGTTGPNSKFHVAGSIYSTEFTTPVDGQIPAIQIGYDSSAGIGILNTWSSRPLRIEAFNDVTIRTTGTDRLIVKATTGNVGINNTNPTAQLQVGPEAHPNATGIEVAAGAGGANLLARDASTHHNWLPFTDGNNYYSASGHNFRSADHGTPWVSITASDFTWSGNTVATRAWVQAQGYLTSETDSQTLSWDFGAKNLSISNGNTVTLDGLATEEFVTSQGYITGYTETDTLATVTNRGASTTNAITVGGATINGTWQTVISTGGGWNKLSFVASNAWGDGTTYGVLGAGGGAEPGVMTYNQHATWVSSSSGAGIRMGRSGGVASGAWYQVATMDSDEFMIAKNGQWSNGGIKITSGGELQHGNSGNRYWHAGNDGSGSGLDADLWDGYHVGQFSNWNSRGANDIVTGMLSWRNYGSNHVIFDASSGVSPTGVSVNISNPDVGWAGSYPTLMGWNGTNTYGVRVDSARVADSAGNADTLDSLDSSEFARGRAAFQVLNLDTIKQPGLYQYDGGIGGTQPEGAEQFNLRTIEIGSAGRYSQMAFDWASEQAWFRRQTGDTWSTWREFIHSGNIASQSVSYADESGYSASSGSVEWTNVQNKPATFPPSSHTHPYLPLSGGTVTGDINTNSAIAFIDGNSGYSNIIRSAGYPSEGYDPPLNYWMEYRAFGGHHFVLNVDGGVGAGENSMDDFVIWQGAIDGDRLLELSNAGNLTIRGTFTESSSIRFKENINPLDPALDKVNQLEAVSYNKIGVDDREIGLIAEDVAELFPEVVTYNEEWAPTGVQYQRLSVILLKAVQELSQEVNELKKKLN